MPSLRPFAATGLILSFLALPPVAHGADVAASSLAATCFTCHGTDGRSAGGIPPSLAGRDRGELAQQMKAFKAGKYPATVMHQIAKGYTDAQIEQIAAHFASVPASAGH